MSKTPYILFAIVFLVVVAFVGWLVLGTGKTSTPQGASTQQSSQSEQVTPSVADNNTIVSPINIHDPAISEASLMYTFTATIKEVRKNPEGLELIPDKTITGLPKLVLKGATDAASFKPNQLVKLGVTYDLKTQQWFVSVVGYTISASPTEP